jgi:hypothetical protein
MKFEIVNFEGGRDAPSSASLTKSASPDSSAAAILGNLARFTVEIVGGIKSCCLGHYNVSASL